MMNLQQTSTAAQTMNSIIIEATTSTTEDHHTASSKNNKILIDKVADKHQVSNTIHDHMQAVITGDSAKIITKRPDETEFIRPDVGILDGKPNKSQSWNIEPDTTADATSLGKSFIPDVGILGGAKMYGRRQKVNNFKHATTKMLQRSLQSEYATLCPDLNITRLFEDPNYDGPSGCACPDPATCGPTLCTCLELETNGEIMKCLEPMNVLCKGTTSIEGIQQAWSMEKCMGGDQGAALAYCVELNCYHNGGSYAECRCKLAEESCSITQDYNSCKYSKCCAEQSDDAGREACWDNTFSLQYQSTQTKETLSTFQECSSGAKSTLQCYCETFTYNICKNYALAYKNACDVMNCCFGQTDDTSRMECFFKYDSRLGYGSLLAGYQDTLIETCVDSGKSNYACSCDIKSLTQCLQSNVGQYIPGIGRTNYTTSCDLFHCCQAETEFAGKKACHINNWRASYDYCMSFGAYSNDVCYCYKSRNVCSQYSDKMHCDLWNCCDAFYGDYSVTADMRRKECIENITGGQPSSAPSEPPMVMIESTPDTASTSPVSSTGTSRPSSANSMFSFKRTVAVSIFAARVVIGWLLST